MTDPRVRQFICVTRVLGPTSSTPPPAGADRLIDNALGQATVWRSAACTLTRGMESRLEAPSLVCDFGLELHGGLQLVIGNTTGNQPARLQVTFGESLAEALGQPNQDHAIHQYDLRVPWAGVHEVGSTGFRYARIELLDDHTSVELLNLRAVSIGIGDAPIGAFECSDPRLNDIWRVGARTVELCMQTHLWDGIKRDRLVWAGDLHPEVMAVLAVFGGHPIVPESLAFVRDESPLPGGWMNGMPTYSLWWVITWRDWYLHTGDLAALRPNQKYLRPLLDNLISLVGEDGSENLPARFLDWATFGDEPALAIGAHALMRMALLAGADLSNALADTDLSTRCRSAADRLSRWAAPATASQQANALRVLAGLEEPVRANVEKFVPNPTFNLSPFYGYYVLEARAMAGDHAGALDLIRRYWGGMLDFGATSFWEHFDDAWLTHQPPYTGVNDWPVDGRPNIHADTGDHCFKGFRHSLCHGWSAGPTVWLTRYVLGVTPTAPGFSRVSIKPNLIGLEWARGTVPTPHGPIVVEHKRGVDGRVETRAKLPDSVVQE